MSGLDKIHLSDARVLVQAWVLLGLVDLGLRWLRFDTLCGVLEWRLWRPKIPPRPDPVLIERMRRWVDAAARRHWTEMTCLRKALVLRRLLGGRGVPSQLRVGVRRDGESLTAHAWLECEGRTVGDLPDGFSVLEAPPNPPGSGRASLSQ